VDELMSGVVVDPAITLNLPLNLLTDLIPAMTDVAEIQVTLVAARLAADIGPIDSPINESRIVRDPSLRRALRVVGSPNEPDNRIATGLELAVGRGALVRFRTIDDKNELVWYCLATQDARLNIQQMVMGRTLPPRELWQSDHAPRVEPERPTVFRLYEQNIGLLTPIIAEQLVRALERYPREWIEDAIGESVAYNRRNWRYIQRILQQWATAGRGDERRESDSRNETHRGRS
jgi:DnaD/phage-associated family protein